MFFTTKTAQKVATEPPTRTTLTAFLNYARKIHFLRVYLEVPSYYTWDTTSKQFNSRKRGMPVEGHDGVFKSNTIGRVYIVDPKNAEYFYLRLLLHTIRGPMCFVDLKTINGDICETYRKACQRLGLLENDNHWELAINEAVQTATTNQIREVFAITCNLHVNIM